MTRVEPFDLLTDPARLRAALDANGLAAPSAHAKLASPGIDVDAVFRAAATVGVTTVIDPMTDPARWTTRRGIQRVADDLSRAAETAAGYGLRVGYHNHAFELETIVDGRSALEVLAEVLDAAVVLEVDTYWAAVGGQDVPALLGRLGDRVRLLHLKNGPITKNNREQLPLGAGGMPVADILAAATALELPVLEFDDYAGDVFEGIATGFAFAGSLQVAR